MDEETRQAFAAVMKLMNDQHERLIEKMTLLTMDFHNTKGFLIEDALGLSRRMASLEERVEALEKKGG